MTKFRAMRDKGRASTGLSLLKMMKGERKSGTGARDLGRAQEE